MIALETILIDMIEIDTEKLKEHQQNLQQDIDSGEHGPHWMADAQKVMGRIAWELSERKKEAAERNQTISSGELERLWAQEPARQ